MATSIPKLVLRPSFLPVWRGGPHFHPVLIVTVRQCASPMLIAPLVTALLPGSSHLVDTSQGASRRAFLAGAGATAASVLLPSRAAHASYAMQQAAVTQHTWTATDKAREKAVYDSIEKSIDRKRPDRPELGECESRPRLLTRLLTRPLRPLQWATLVGRTPRRRAGCAMSTTPSSSSSSSTCRKAARSGRVLRTTWARPPGWPPRRAQPSSSDHAPSDGRVHF